MPDFKWEILLWIKAQKPNKTPGYHRHIFRRPIENAFKKDESVFLKITLSNFVNFLNVNYFRTITSQKNLTIKMEWHFHETISFETHFTAILPPLPNSKKFWFFFENATFRTYLKNLSILVVVNSKFAIFCDKKFSNSELSSDHSAGTK